MTPSQIVTPKVLTEVPAISSPIVFPKVLPATPSNQPPMEFSTKNLPLSPVIAEKTSVPEVTRAPLTQI